METFLIFISIALGVVTLVILVGLNDRIKDMDEKISRLNSQLKEKVASPAPKTFEPRKSTLQDELEKLATKPEPVYTPPIIVEEIKPVEKYTIPIPEPVSIPTPAPKPAAKRKPTFFERNPDLEKFIGENLVNKIGIAVLVLGIGFFVKYAIDQNWINAIGRVAIGVLCGGILLGFAHYLRVRFKAFSSVLVGGGLTVLYFTIAIAFHQYQLFSQPVAFIIMVVITIFAVILSLAYNRIEIAILSVIGGFSTPFILSTGEGNYIVLFTYLMILNVGMLVLSYFKKWNVINILAYAFTILIYGGWLASRFNSADAPYIGALVFGSLFYFVFFLMNIIHNVKEKRVFGGLDFALLISNTFLYYAAGMFILHHIDEGRWEGFFTAGLGAFNFIFAYLLYKNKGIDRNLVFLLIGLVLSLVSLAAPVQLHGQYITLFWAAETALLLWLSQKSGIKLMKLASVILMGLMLISLFMDWYQVYLHEHYFGSADFTPFTIILNKGFITGITVVISMYVTTVFLTREKEPKIYGFIDVPGYRTFISLAAVGVLYLTMFFELHYQLYARIASGSFCEVVTGLYNLLFITGLVIVTMRRNLTVLSNIFIGLGGFILVLYLLYYNEEIVSLRNDYLSGSQTTPGMYWFHYFTVLSALGLLVSLFLSVKKFYTIGSELGKAFLWFMSLILVYIFSSELSNIIVVSSYASNPSIQDITSQVSKIGFPILWGISSFILMLIGMRLKIQHFRIISLSLFFITLVKLFLFDIRDVPQGGKIAAFIILGVILLVISFMYQKLKVLILSDKQEVQKEKKE